MKRPSLCPRPHTGPKLLTNTVTPCSRTTRGVTGTTNYALALSVLPGLGFRCLKSSPGSQPSPVLGFTCSPVRPSLRTPYTEGKRGKTGEPASKKGRVLDRDLSCVLSRLCPSPTPGLRTSGVEVVSSSDDGVSGE